MFAGQLARSKYGRRMSVSTLRSEPRDESARLLSSGQAPSIWLGTCARAGARSLRLAQRIVFGIIRALDFTAVEALISNLKPGAKGFGRAQV